MKQLPRSFSSEEEESAAPPSSTALRRVIGATLVVGALFVAVLVVRATVAPNFLMPTTQATPTSAPTLAPPPPPPVPPPLPEVAAPAPSAPVVAASASAPAPTASAAASASAKPARRYTGEPAVVELPDDFQYHPSQPNNLTIHVPQPATSTTTTWTTPSASP